MQHVHGGVQHVLWDETICHLGWSHHILQLKHCFFKFTAWNLAQACIDPSVAVIVGGASWPRMVHGDIFAQVCT